MTSHKELLQDFVDDSFQQSVNCIKEYLSFKFVLFFNNFIHEKLNKVSETGLAKYCPSLKQNEMKLESSGNCQTLEDSRDQSLNMNFENCSLANTDKINSKKICLFKKFSAQTIDNRSKKKYNASYQDVCNKKCPSNQTKPVTKSFTCLSTEKKQDFDISSSNDFPRLPVTSHKLASNLNKNICSQKPKSRRIKPTLLRKQTDSNNLAFGDQISLSFSENQLSVVEDDINQKYESLFNTRHKDVLNLNIFPETKTLVSFFAIHML